MMQDRSPDRSQERREQILQRLRGSAMPVPGYAMAEKFQVSRQTIVQDIAFLRKDGHPILSTTQGYLITKGAEEHRMILGISHTREQLRQELEILVSHQLTVEDVFIDHPVYGRIRGVLHIATAGDIERFMHKRATSSIPLFSEVTGGQHYHTLVTSYPERVIEAREALVQAGFRLLPVTGSI